MGAIEDLRAKVAEATARADAAVKAGDEAAEQRAVEDESAAQGALVVELERVGKLTGKRLERAARAAAFGGGYQIGHFDVGSRLPQLDPAKLPAGGVVLFRSPALDVRKRNEAETMDGSGVDAADAAINLITACTLAPAFDKADPAGAIAYRRFWEQEGRGIVTLAAVEIARLGGFQLAAFQRASK